MKAKKRMNDGETLLESLSKMASNTRKYLLQNILYVSIYINNPNCIRR